MTLQKQTVQKQSPVAADPPKAPTSGLGLTNANAWSKAWRLLPPQDRSYAMRTLVVVVLGALSSAMMVASILPFLSVLADPDRASQSVAIQQFAQLFGLRSQYDILVGLGFASLVIILAASALQIWRVLVLERFAVDQALKISTKMLGTYLAHPYPFFINRHGSDIATIILSEVGEAIAFFIRPAMELIASLLTLIAVMVLLIWLYPSVSILAFLIVGAAYGLTFLMSRRYLRRQGQIRAVGNAARYRVTNEAFDGIKTVKLFGLEKRYMELYRAPAEQVVKTIFATRVVSQLPRNIIYALVSGGVVVLCLLFVPADKFASGQALSDLLPMLGVFGFAAQRLIPELQKVYSATTDMQYGQAAVDRVYDDLVNGQTPEFSDPPAPLPFKNNLVLETLTYSYPQAALPSIEGVSLELCAGEKIGIVGSTGAGKTTLADLILGLLSPDHGRILLDGQPLDAQALPAWHQTVAYVPQDIFITDGTMAENIAFGVVPENIDWDRLKEAARNAQLADLIETDMPKGFETSLGEKGVRLSGGQKQRVGIARALYRDADLIVMDEGTSALDGLTETEVMTALNNLPTTKTIVLIAHRLSTIKACDRIVVLDQGRLAGLGPWETLVNDNPVFAKLASAGAH